MFAIIFVVGNQEFSNQPGFTDFPNTPGTPILGEYAPSGPPPPLPYQSEQVRYLYYPINIYVNKRAGKTLWPQQ